MPPLDGYAEKARQRSSEDECWISLKHNRKKKNHPHLPTKKLIKKTLRRGKERDSSTHFIHWKRFGALFRITIEWWHKDYTTKCNVDQSRSTHIP